MVGHAHGERDVSEFLLFFFSSRRRHTRSYGDWSSDVCSSDLSTIRRASPNRGPYRVTVSCTSRSEERRVGKECRYRWSPDHQKKKKDRIDGRSLWNTHEGQAGGG